MRSLLILALVLSACGTDDSKEEEAPPVVVESAVLIVGVCSPEAGGCRVAGYGKGNGQLYFTWSLGTAPLVCTAENMFVVSPEGVFVLPIMPYGAVVSARVCALPGDLGKAATVATPER